jgi:cytosine/adenosine deaminase-related metal-dependent hydrolase
MVLNNIKLPGGEKPAYIRISDGKIAEISPYRITGDSKTRQIKFTGAMAFPGLINSHDHLDFNLFPQLGDRVYTNYTEWGNHIHLHYKNEIAEILKVPAALRYRWGVYKNLLCGVTTVVNHGEPSGLNSDIITVFEQAQSIHSVQFEKNWKQLLNSPLKIKLPVNIHTGEGSDKTSTQEIDQLIKWNLLRRPLIGVHAVAMTEKQAAHFKAIVWCPQSNYFLLNKTARVDILKKQSTLLFGTDSTLTSHWDIWEHLRTAVQTGLIDNETLYQSLNQKPAKIWKLNCGEIAVGKDADIVIAKINKQKNNLDTFFSFSPADLQMVIHKGEIRLFDEKMLPQMGGIDLTKYSKIYINKEGKYVEGNLPGLIREIKTINPAINFPVKLMDMDIITPSEN